MLRIHYSTVQRMHSWCTLRIPKQRIIRSGLNEENVPAPQMFGYGATVCICWVQYYSCFLNAQLRII